jgi:hypothetical protein
MFVGALTGPYHGLLVANFAVGSGRLKRDLESNPHWAPFWGQMVTNTHIRWQILRFTDCQGGEGANELLRWERAIAVNNALPRYARNQVDGFRAAPLDDCMASNGDEQGRMHNRGAFIRQISTAYWFPEETITRDLPAGPFLDLQIPCVIDAGGCSTPRTIAALDRLCRPSTGYRGRPLIQLDLVCGTPGLGIAQSLKRAYPGWRSAMPRCPCTRAAAAAAPGFSYDLGPLVSNYHPGASACYRSDPVATAAGTAHRQQCCYDGSGALMVGTAGDGTPDVWGRSILDERHQRIDVRPHGALGYRLYNRYWVPDPGVGCTP